MVNAAVEEIDEIDELESIIDENFRCIEAYKARIATMVDEQDKHLREYLQLLIEMRAVQKELLEVSRKENATECKMLRMEKELARLRRWKDRYALVIKRGADNAGGSVKGGGYTQS